MSEYPSIKSRDHQAYMHYALSQARKVLPKPTNFCVGAVLVEETQNQIVSTGFTNELPGNTHAEQCCLTKYQQHALAVEKDASVVAPQVREDARLVLYTTMEPCNSRASGNIPCTETILRGLGGAGGIRTVYVGVKEPEKFVGENVGRAKLEQAGIEYVHVPGLENEILAVATAGHEE